MGLLECAARCMPWASAEQACTKQITCIRRLAGLTALDLDRKWWRFGCSLCYVVLDIRRYLCQHGLCLLARRQAFDITPHGSHSHTFTQANIKQPSQLSFAENIHSCATVLRGGCLQRVTLCRSILRMQVGHATKAR